MGETFGRVQMWENIVLCKSVSHSWWHTLVILATQEDPKFKASLGNIWDIQVGLGKKNHENGFSKEVHYVAEIRAGKMTVSKSFHLRPLENGLVLL